MQDWHSTCLGQRTLPRDLSAFEIEAFFKTSPTLNGVLSKIGGPALKLAADRFPAHDRAPPPSGAHWGRLIFRSSLRPSMLSGAIAGHVGRLRSNLPDELRSRTLSLVDLDTSPPPSGRWIQFVLGHRASQSRATGRILSSQLELIPSFEFDDRTYEALQINRAEYTASAYDDEVPVDGKWQTSPKPKGMSGGAILDIYGLSPDPRLPPAETLEAKLSSIVTAWRPPIDGAPSVLVGSRVSDHLNLIKECWPEIDTGFTLNR
jgi:hypothetical protein